MTRRLAAFLAAVTLLAGCQQGADRPRPVTVIERSAPQSTADESVKAAVIGKLADLDRRAYRAVTPEVWGGRVLLMGAVIKPEHRRKAEQAARSVEGVADVFNELVLAEDKALDVFSPDPAREQLVRSRLGLDKRGPALRVVNGVAFLLGSVPQADQAAALKAEAGEVEGVKWVVAYLK